MCANDNRILNINSQSEEVKTIIEEPTIDYSVITINERLNLVAFACLNN